MRDCNFAGRRYVSSTNIQTAKGGRAFTVVTQTDQPVLISVVERDDVETKRKENAGENKRKAGEEEIGTRGRMGRYATDNLPRPIPWL